MYDPSQGQLFVMPLLLSPQNVVAAAHGPKQYLDGSENKNVLSFSYLGSSKQSKNS